VSRPSDAPARTEPTSPAPDSVVILDYGSQYAQLIARRVREANVYCELVPHDVEWEVIQRLAPKGIILSGGPASVYEPDAPHLPNPPPPTPPPPPPTASKQSRPWPVRPPSCASPSACGGRGYLRAR